MCTYELSSLQSTEWTETSITGLLLYVLSSSSSWDKGLEGELRSIYLIHRRPLARSPALSPRIDRIHHSIQSLTEIQAGGQFDMF